ncbi:hypothetical protein BLW93_07315 [Desulfurobacterium indicum]|uniref:Uncharacterized protein n=1 Tax=Desulfurobacterium indicum TaxID=1914305 RepID=A0A1R1MJV3_9BACT|nr:hypothetical protein BLW93_07315 [Desulfurobacterium indicum]
MTKKDASDAALALLYVLQTLFTQQMMVSTLFLQKIVSTAALALKCAQQIASVLNNSLKAGGFSPLSFNFQL